MSKGFRRALEILRDHPRGILPEDFYKLMWPGRKGGRNSTKGGPSGAECAANWLLGRIERKYQGSVYRYAFLDDNRARAGMWVILPNGRRALTASDEAIV
jgi:hypothetical protein